MESEFNVRRLEPQEWNRWDEFVARSPQGTLFHSSSWLDAQGTPFQILGCFSNDELTGGIAIENVGCRSAGHGRLTPYLGMVLPPPAKKYVTTITLEKKVSAACARHLKHDFDSIYCRMSPDHLDLQPFIWEGYAVGVRYTYRLPLDDLDDIWKNMESTRRNDIRSAVKNGIAVDSDVEFSQLFSLVESTFDRQGQCAMFRTAAFRTHEILASQKRCRAFLARDAAGEDLAAAYIVWDEKCAYYILGGYDARKSHRGAGALAIWEAIQFSARSLGLPLFDFEGSTIQSIERFFRDFGGILTPSYTVTWKRRSLQRDINRVKNRIIRILARR